MWTESTVARHPGISQRNCIILKNALLRPENSGLRRAKVELPGWGTYHAFGVFRDPIAPVLQNKTTLLCRNFYFLQERFKVSFTFPSKNKSPSEGGTVI